MTLFVGPVLPNRQWSNPQLTDGDKALLLAMLPVCQACGPFSYHQRDVWEWLHQHIAPSMIVVRLNDLSDLPALKARHDEGYDCIVQLGNEPRNQGEPWGGDMVAYYRWCDQAIVYLRANCPRWAICAGPLSPGVDFEATLMSSGYQALVSRCEFVPAHAYYQRPEDLIGLAGGVVLRVHQAFPTKRLLITEFCCTAGEGGQPRPRHELAGEYVAFAQWANQQGWIDCLLYFILGSNDQHWITVGETFDMGMARAIGGIEFSQPEEETMPTFRVGNLEVQDLRASLPKHATLRYEVRSIGGIEMIVIHHSATPDDHSAQAIAEYHVNTQGWPGMAYHFAVHQDGRIEYTQGIEVTSFGVARRNDNTMHICLPGDWTSKKPPAVQIARTRELIANFALAMGRVYPVVGHCEIAPADYTTACPGATYPSWKGELVGVAPATPPGVHFELGFAAYAAAHPEVGQAASAMSSDRWGNVYQDSTTGKLVWWKRAGVIEFHAG